MFIKSELMAGFGFNVVFSDRFGGCSEGAFASLNLGYELGDARENADENLARLCKASGSPVPHQVKQVHGTAVFVCEGEGQVHSIEADILLSADKAACLAVRTADCVPILIADKKTGSMAAVHAGWRGTAAQAVRTAIQSLLMEGAEKSELLACIGPCIHKCCFETNEEIADVLRKSCGKSVSQMQDGQIFSDLVEANYQQLRNLGISDANIDIISRCTHCYHEHQYFSYRRDNGVTGRQLSMISRI